jgi:hypothetical protein
MSDMTPAELINTIRTAGLIKVHDGKNWIDLRPRLVDFIETAILVRAELDHQVREVEELNERIQKVANGMW